ncbi:hypothetical protein K523DRAFT_322190 [Schizophyllum commune Tattone D]|nr:hypothetical protein K523DRAFT_325265 [Schizophyllum commune Tattone D]KAI5834424.1 hypothetical protein K523DRAFT_322190 [Schizophyllum commune Tattone D]
MASGHVSTLSPASYTRSAHKAYSNWYQSIEGNRKYNLVFFPGEIDHFEGEFTGSLRGFAESVKHPV